MLRIAAAAMVLGMGALAILFSAPAARAAEPWRHGVFEAKSDAGILFMVTQGFAQKQGLDV